MCAFLSPTRRKLQNLSRRTVLGAIGKQFDFDCWAVPANQPVSFSQRYLSEVCKNLILYDTIRLTGSPTQNKESLSGEDGLEEILTQICVLEPRGTIRQVALFQGFLSSRNNDQEL